MKLDQRPELIELKKRVQLMSTEEKFERLTRLQRTCNNLASYEDVLRHGLRPKPETVKGRVRQIRDEMQMILSSLMGAQLDETNSLKLKGYGDFVHAITYSLSH